MYTNRIVAMATGRGLRGWTDHGRSGTAVTGGKRRAAGRNRKLARRMGMAYDDGRTGAWVQVRLGRRTGRKTS